MKVTVEYDLPEEINQLHLSLKADDMYSILWDVVNTLIRNKLKYGNFSEETVEQLEEIQRFILDEINDRQIPSV